MKNNFNEFESVIRKRSLLPWWIKIFCWIFMVIGMLSLFVVFLVIANYEPELEIFGFNANENHPYNSILILFSFLFLGVTGYLLWFEKRKAIIIGQINALWGIILCLISMGLGLVNGNFVFRIELFFLVLFFVKLSQIKPKWS